MSSKTKKKQGAKAPKNKKHVILSVVASVLAAVILTLSLLLTLGRSPVAMRYGGAALREDVYSYWFSSYKYQFLIAYKQLDIDDSESGWARIDSASGKSYNDAFKAAIDKEIAMRFIASVLFDQMGASLSDADLSAIASTLSDMEEYSFGEKPFKLLKSRYGVTKADLKKVALYEVKYKALLSVLYGSDYSGVYSAENKEALTAFYKDHYKRYNLVYLSDEKSASVQSDLRTYIASGITEAAFTEWETEYSETRVTEDYPNGIYLYDGIRYNNRFSEELLSAFASLEVGECTEVRNAKDDGSYFVMRYALDEAPYLSSDKKVQDSLENFAEYAARSFYRRELEEGLAEVSWVKEITDAYTPVSVKKEMDYNLVNLLG